MLTVVLEKFKFEFEFESLNLRVDCKMKPKLYIHRSANNPIYGNIISQKCKLHSFQINCPPIYKSGFELEKLESLVDSSRRID